MISIFKVPRRGQIEETLILLLIHQQVLERKSEQF